MNKICGLICSKMCYNLCKRNCSKICGKNKNKVYKVDDRPFSLKVLSAQAHNLRSTDKFTKIDPYLIMKVNQQKKQTLKIYEGGQNTKWSNVNWVVKNCKREMEIHVYVGGNDIFGYAKLSEVDNGTLKVNLRIKGKSAGTVNLYVEKVY